MLYILMLLFTMTSQSDKCMSNTPFSHIILATMKCLFRHQSFYFLNAEMEVAASDVICSLSASPRWRSGLISR